MTIISVLVLVLIATIGVSYLVVTSPIARNVGLVSTGFWAALAGSVVMIRPIRKLVVTLLVLWAVVTVSVGYKDEIKELIGSTKGFIDTYQKAKQEAWAATEELNRQKADFAIQQAQRERDLQAREAAAKQQQDRADELARKATIKAADAAAAKEPPKPVQNVRTADLQYPAYGYQAPTTYQEQTLTPKSAAASKTEYDALVLISKQFENHSSGDPDTVDPAIYGDVVLYYGKVTPLANVIKDKQAYYDRWPNRAYKIKSIKNECADEVNGQISQCVFYGTVEFDVSNQVQRITGTATFEYTLRYHIGIAVENGKVLTRQVTNLQPQPQPQQVAQQQCFLIFCPPH